MGKELQILKDDWHGLIQRVNPDIDKRLVEETFVELVACHSQPQRFYHTLNHIYEITLLEKKFEKNLTNPVRVKVAKWFHDCIYDPKSSINEDNSAIFCSNSLKKLNVASQVVETAQKDILASKNHILPKDNLKDRDLAYFLDFDLWILASPPERYREYVDQIRQEYSHMNLEEGRLRRSKVLEQFLNRDRIFITEEMNKEYEDIARNNIKQELASYLR